MSVGQVFSAAVAEGFIPYHIPSLPSPCETWYRTIGDVASVDATPLIIVHGGPGAPSDYLFPLERLNKPERPLIFYDAVGNGRSTHLPQYRGNETFWGVDLFMDELTNVISYFGLDKRTFDVYGQSWGAMLSANYAIRGPYRDNVRKLILSSGSASNEMYQKGIDEEVAKFPPDMKKAAEDALQTGDYDTPEFRAVTQYYLEHLLSVAKPFPVPPLQSTMDWLAKDDTVHFTAFGPSFFKVTGWARDWDLIADVHKINAQTLVISGEFEGALRVAAQPFIDLIEDVEAVDIKNASHMAHLDQPESYFAALESFLCKPIAKKFSQQK